MGKRQETLSRLLSAAGIRASTACPSCHHFELFAECGIEAEVRHVYQSLGGRASVPRIKHGKWDIATKQGMIELDEERHFNRFRRLTLDAPLYSRLEVCNLAQYRAICVDRERECLAAARHGGNWKTDSAEREFGPSSPEGVLEEPGPARWKQRAFYDFIKDVASIALEIRVRRLAIYEELTVKSERTTLNDVLTGRFKGASDQELGLALAERLQLTDLK